MRRTISARLLSLFLVIALLASCCPAVYAAEVTEGTQQTETAEVTEATEAAEETEPTETTEAAEAAEPTETTEATEATESTEPTQATEAAGVTEPTEETEESKLAFGFQGLPEGYVFSEKALEDKLELAEDETVGKLEELNPGEDYAAGELIVPAETREEAELYAQAYCAELVDYDYGMALLRLQEATVLDAVTLAQDMDVPLPAAWPNYLITLDPMEETYREERPNITTMGLDAPQRETWNTWVNEMLTTPDPAIQIPVDRGNLAFWNDDYQYMHEVIDSYGAWGATTGRGVTVAVVDTGIKTGHPDLSGRVSYYDVGMGVEDELGHGTHVAGIIGATLGNGMGGAGVAPNVHFASIRIFTDITTSDFYIAKGINKAVDVGADVINLSLGGISANAATKSAVDRAIRNNIVVVAAMGNDGMNRINYPAAYPGVIGVVASGTDNTRANYSNYGSWADIAAPGSNIYSTTNDGSYGLMSGTSMACPVVSGVAALYKSIYPDATPSKVESRMKSTATKGGGDLGVGIVNAANMLSYKPGKPILELYTDSNIYSTGDGTLGSSVPCESQLYIRAAEKENDAFLLYTINGKNPGVKDGVVVTGERYDEAGYIDLSAYAGQTVTIRAMQVSGLGVSGAVVTKQLKVNRSQNVTDVIISGPRQLVAGKKGEFTAVVEPADKADQGVTWRLIVSEASGVKLDPKTGVLTTSKNSSGDVVIQAISNADTNCVAWITVNIKPVNPVATLKLSDSTKTIAVGNTEQLWVTSAIDTAKQAMSVEGLDLKWTSSNTKVAVVDKDGYITGVGKGTATVTCKVLDGSGKTAKCTVTVQKVVEEIRISGQSSIAPGATAAYKATILPQDASIKKIWWSLEDEPEGVTVDANGKVKVPASVKSGSFYVEAVVADLGVACGRIRVDIVPKCTAVTVEAWGSTGSATGCVYSKKGVLTGVNLFNVDLPDTSGTENTVWLSATAVGSGQAAIKWTSSKPGVAAVDEDGVVTALSAGTTTVTAAAQDGSGKKVSVTVKVAVPVSTMSLTSTALKAAEDLDLLAIGKSYKHKVTFGNLYGKPTNQKVTWNWMATTRRNGSLSNITGYVSKLISCKGGTLNVKAGLKSYLRSYGNMQVTVYAESTDGTDVVAMKTYDLTMGATVLNWYGDLRSSGDGYYIYFYSDQAYVSGSSGRYSQFNVTSSNPNVLNPGDVVFSGSTYRGMNVYAVYLYPGVKGKAKLTVKTTDGTNKSISITGTIS